MKNIVIFGAGRSSSVLIDYLLQESEKNNWQITLCDQSEELALAKLAGNKNGTAQGLDIHDENTRDVLIMKADLVISMLPVFLHTDVAKSCLKHGKNMLSASYVNEDIRGMEKAVKDAGLLFIKECGLDPGIDHMTAMQAIDEIRAKGGRLTGFRSYTGGLIAPESDNNPWHYKFTWNPRNVVLAGKATARYLRHGKYKYIPYHQLFTRTDRMSVEGYGDFDGYANRDSLAYRELYGIQDTTTILRGTLRRPGYCQAWQTLIDLGMTDDSFEIDSTPDMTYREFTNLFLRYDEGMTVEQKVCATTGIDENGEVFNALRWLGLFEEKPLPVAKGSPAHILQHILEEKWTLKPEDKDMIVMQHIFDYELEGAVHRLTSSMVVQGDDQVRTGMAKTVGLPLGITAKLMLEGRISLKGVHIPIHKEIYDPVLAELETLGMKFTDLHEIVDEPQTA
ncbi:saccharopine dehydrogenase C-terminal domain-containing protein [Roseivirga sp. BDSF3-8]|uniref:saccharopine dehydrogenase C-terminal domain-containing protein n=1 Tax=Roseivirga sp. BDSF3-8 TaxID=3241598 RepID=UPI003531BD7C